MKYSPEKYYIIQNFSKNGNLGINLDVIKEITTQAVLSIKGADLYRPKKSDIRNYPIILKFGPRGLFLTVSIKITNGENIDKISTSVQERIERDIMYMTEINPTRIDIIIEEVLKA